MDILVQHQDYIREKYMSWFKKILLGLIILAGVIGLLKDYKDFGLFGALGLFIIFLLTTIFLWQWASGRLPEITKLQAIFILLASAIASIFVINMAIAGNLHVDLMEVMRVSITHNPLFYLILCVTAWVKVGIWQWLFNGVGADANRPV
jgi:glucan phosphoethanolaminetransferase (alkaline phosphatase superfamily)